MQKRNKLILTNFLTVLFCIISMSVVIYATISNSNSIIDVYGKEQQEHLDEIVRQVTTILNDTEKDKEKTKTDKIIDIIKNQTVSGSQYWMFGVDNLILFLRDESLSSSLSGETFKSLFAEYKANEGENINQIQDMFKLEKSGTVIFSKRNNARQEILTLKFFQVGEKTYTVGVTTSKDFVLSNAKVFETSTYIYIITALCCIIIIVMKVYFSMVITQKDDEIIKNSQELIERNKLIEEYYSNENPGVCYDDKDNIYDQLTTAYNKRFFNAVSDNLKKRETPSVFILMINIKKDYKKSDNKVIIDIADIIKESVDENAMVFRISDLDFAVMLINSDMEKAQINADIIEDNIIELTGGQPVDIDIINHDNLIKEQRELKFA